MLSDVNEIKYDDIERALPTVDVKYDDIESAFFEYKAVIQFDNLEPINSTGIFRDIQQCRNKNKTSF